MDILNTITSLNLPKELLTIIVAASPVLELRGAIPLAMGSFKFTFLKTYSLSVFGNFLPIIPLLFFLEYAVTHLMRFKIFNKIFTWWFERTRKHSDLVDKYEALGLLLFVAVPLPVTGAWTGCVAAYLFGIKKRYAVPAIFLGVLIAGFIVSAITIGTIKIL
ncbi:COG2426 family protein [bacterium]